MNFSPDGEINLSHLKFELKSPIQLLWVIIPYCPVLSHSLIYQFCYYVLPSKTNGYSAGSAPRLAIVPGFYRNTRVIVATAVHQGKEKAQITVGSQHCNRTFLCSNSIPLGENWVSLCIRKWSQSGGYVGGTHGSPWEPFILFFSSRNTYDYVLLT